MGVLVGKPAPDFTCAAVLGNGEIVESFTLSEVAKGKYTVVFFYPLDFTFVCPTELHAFGDKLEEFKKRNVELIAISWRLSAAPAAPPSAPTPCSLPSAAGPSP